MGDMRMIVPTMMYDAALAPNAHAEPMTSTTVPPRMAPANTVS